MVPGEKVKQILYSVIEETGKENIQMNISSNIESSQKHIDNIMGQCITKLTSESDDHEHDIIIATLCEALLHFMLTISTLPSERKVEVREGLTLDIVIPNIQCLRRNPDKCIIIQIIKDKKHDLTKIELLELLQPTSKNIWLLSTKPLSIAKYTEYNIFPSHGSYNYSNIITDIDKFLKEIKDKSFRFIP
jgi:hypothetical protein